MKDRSEIKTPALAGGSETVTIRMARSADEPALRVLAQLDSVPPPEPSPTLVAQVDGELHAALALDDGEAIANPFRRTAHLVAMLTARAEHARSQPPARTRRRLRLIQLRAAPAPRA